MLSDTHNYRITDPLIETAALFKKWSVSRKFLMDMTKLHNKKKTSLSTAMDGLNILGKINRLRPFFYVHNAVDNDYKSTSLFTLVFAALFSLFFVRSFRNHCLFSVLN